MRLYDGLPAIGPCEGCGFTTCRCKAELAERRAAARDEVVRAAVAWYAARPRPDDAAFMDTLDALHAAVAALARLEKP